MKKDLHNVPRRTIPNCKPCFERGRIRSARYWVAGELMCDPCFSEKPAVEPSLTCEVVQRSMVPTRTGSVIRQGLELLKASGALSIKLTPENIKPQQVQTWVFTYAARMGMKVKTRKIGGVVYVERVPA